MMRLICCLFLLIRQTALLLSHFSSTSSFLRSTTRSAVAAHPPTFLRNIRFGSTATSTSHFLTRNSRNKSFFTPSGRLLFASYLAARSSTLLPTASALYSTSAATMSASTTEAAEANAPVEYFRKDYTPPPYTIDQIYLDFNLHETDTIVTATSHFKPTTTKAGQCADLVLDGEEVVLQELYVNNQLLVANDHYVVKGDQLTIFGHVLEPHVPKGEFELRTVVKINPEKNTALSGLYKSGGPTHLLSTQCEAMGFRRITYYLDRPDVLAIYKVRLEADKVKYPVLLSNGNRLEAGEVSGTDRHYAIWEDPFPKPSYLFALVAGELASIHDTYTTTSGRVVQLGIYSDKENQDKLDHAMYSLKASMKWDEDTFGLECDLDIYNVVATNDFNMGAMENKGLNIFNSAYVLADPKTATDVDYENILGVIGHEYFHNWSGNRVTVRDWFQLTLKEGLTVYRDQWFSSDLTSEAVKRVEDVRGLRSRQFAEDAGPMAHPIRPESYISMDNFYTSTVYSKGAEIIGIYRTLLGTDGFKKGLKLYFDRHDGTAVTCDDFRQAMGDANGVDLSQMDNWYTQAGTPVVTITQEYDEVNHVFTLHASQYTPSTPGQSQDEKKPVIIPLVTGLLHPVTGEQLLPESRVLVLKEAQESFRFENIPVKPVVSTLRGFSAPINLHIDQSDDELILLMAHETDSFNKWDAGHRYYTKLLLQLAEQFQQTPDVHYELPEKFVNAVNTILESAKDASQDRALIAYALQLPDMVTLMNQVSVVHIEALHKARSLVKKQLATKLRSAFEHVYQLSNPVTNEYTFSPQETGRRRLRNTCLDYLASIGDAQSVALTKLQFDTANCMTDKIAALSALASVPGPERDEALATFHADAQGQALVLNKWFSIQATASYDNVLQDVIKLKTSHPDFTLNNPNRARSLLSAFGGMNHYYFHDKTGAGYQFMADCIMELDKINPQVAARMMSIFAQWKKFDTHRQGLMQEQLQRIKNTEHLSPDTFEIVSRYLK